METDAIRKAFRKRPFTGVELFLSSGEVVACPSPEVVISEDLFVTLDQHQEVVLIDPEGIVKIRTLPKRRKTGSQNAPTPPQEKR